MTRLGFGKLGRRRKNLDDRLNAGTWTRFFTENLGGDLQLDVGELLGGGQASGVPLLAETGLPEATDESGELVLGLGGGGIDLLEISSEELVDLDLEGVELLNGLLEDVADHQLGAVISVQLVGGVVEGSKDIGLSISLSAIWKQLFTKKCALI